MQIFELTNKECVEALSHMRLGRLACSRDDQPYLVPIHFVYHANHLYSFATRGQKIDWMRTNPRVCVEADEIVNHRDWMSVVVQGRYEEMPDMPEWKPERELAHGLLEHQPMWWEPAYVGTAHPGATDELIPIYFRIHIDHLTGRRAKPDPCCADDESASATASSNENWLKRLFHR
jgi:uncharacterized protein